MRARHCLLAAILSLATSLSAQAATNITFTRGEIAQMSGLWETDCLTISPLANSQYPVYASNWQYIFPHTSISADGDIHVDMAIDSAGSGSSGNNTGESPIICEVTNSTSAQLSYLDSLSAHPAIFRGIFRFYTEHPGERHFELHPVVELDTWNGANFVANTDYHLNVASVANATTHTDTTLANAINGSETMTATIESDNTHVDFTLPSPSVNYVQYDGTALSAVTTDSTSSYFLFQPNLVPAATLRCRLVANTSAASAAAGLHASQSVTVNALTRTDVSQVQSQIATMSAGQSQTFPRPIELILLGLPNIGPTPSPTATPIPSTHSFTNSASLSMSGASNGEGKGSPYPSIINVTGIPGTIRDVTAQLNKLTHPFPVDLDILLVGPDGQNVMLMSDTGGLRSVKNIDLTLDDSATSSLTTSKITSGTYLPTNLNPSGDKDAFPVPAPAKPYGTAFFVFDGESPNGTWKLFVLDEFTSGSGTIGGGWTINITTQLAPPLSAVSRKTYASGGDFDVDLPITGAPGIECRTGGQNGDHKVLIKFANAVSVGGASVVSSDGQAMVSSFSVSGAVVTVNLTKVTNKQTIVITLTNVSDGTNIGNASISMGVLLGDTSGDGVVNSADITQTRSQSGNAADAGNFREDLTVDGVINSADITLVRRQSGTALP